MTANCALVQLSHSLCQSHVPANILQKLDSTKIQNPIVQSLIDGDGLDTSFEGYQVLNWTPTTEGTVSLQLYRVPKDGDLVELQAIVPSIENTGQYTWTPFQITDQDSIAPGGPFTVSITPDSDPSKTNFWPAFAIDDPGAQSSKDGADGIASTIPEITSPTSNSIVAALPQTILTDSMPLATSVIAAPRLDTSTTTPILGASVTRSPPKAETSKASPAPSAQASPPRAIAPGVIAAVVLGAITIVLLSIFVAILACKRRRRRDRRLERQHELPCNEKSRAGASSRGGMSERHPHTHPPKYTGINTGRRSLRTDHDRWHRQRELEKRTQRDREQRWERERMQRREREKERVELESGWGPPEADSRRLYGKGAYVSPRVSVPPKSRVVSEYL